MNTSVGPFVSPYLKAFRIAFRQALEVLAQSLNSLIPQLCASAIQASNSLTVGLHLADIIKPLLHAVRLAQVFTVQKHQITGLSVLILQLFIAGQDELAAAFVILTQGNRHGLLKPPAYVFNGPCDLADEMVFIHNNLCVWEEALCRLCIGLPHIADEELYIQTFFPRDTAPIISQMTLGPVGKDIEDALLFQINQDTLISTGGSVPFESINGKCLWEPVGRNGETV